MENKEQKEGEFDKEFFEQAVKRYELVLEIIRVLEGADVPMGAKIGNAVNFMSKEMDLNVKALNFYLLTGAIYKDLILNEK